MMGLPPFLRNLLGHRPEALQVAALCRRGTGKDTEVLLVSSLDTKRCIVPKGWPMRGRTLAEAALREAWEEAGVLGHVQADPVGAFHYDKRRKTGLVQRCKVLCFVVDVTGLDADFPERGRRDRHWLSPKAAAKCVKERELKALLRRLA
ncbi:NUDIX hydrolase [Rhodobacter capsulatus]|uniref:NUDIX hydrolase n=1 Tax=Rhodobacter capsulatus TaxID=1061 RepID=UPI00402604B3